MSCIAVQKPFIPTSTCCSYRCSNEGMPKQRLIKRPSFGYGSKGFF